MKSQQIKEFLMSVGEIELLTPKSSPEIRQGDERNEVKFQDEFIEIHKKHNPSLGFKIKKINDHIELCQIGCGQIVTNQRIEYRAAHPDEPNWRVKCANCGKYKHPSEPGIIENKSMMPTIFAEYRKSLKDK